MKTKEMRHLLFRLVEAFEPDCFLDMLCDVLDTVDRSEESKILEKAVGKLFEARIGREANRVRKEFGK